jgi:hypothetical protein
MSSPLSAIGTEGYTAKVLEAARKLAAKHAHMQQSAEAALHRREELKALSRLQLAHHTMVKHRLAALRRGQLDMQRRARQRALATAHTQRLTTIRTKRFVDGLRRKTQSLRNRRSSLQTALTTKLVKAAADQTRAAALDEQRMAMDEANAVQATLQVRMEAMQHAMKLQTDMVKEEEAVRAQERQLAARAQELLLRRALVDLTADAATAAQAAEDAGHEAEDKFLAESIDALDLMSARCGLADPLAVLQAAALQSSVDRAAATLRTSKPPPGRNGQHRPKPRQRRRSSAGSLASTATSRGSGKRQPRVPARTARAYGLGASR